MRRLDGEAGRTRRQVGHDGKEAADQRGTADGGLDGCWSDLRWADDIPATKRQCR